MDALRAGRAKTYIPECLVPHDPETGRLIKPNMFDNRYFAADGDMRDKQQNVINTDQPVIPHESYLASYVTALDLCLQGIISPSTLGIDVKKLDNAEAQREKDVYKRQAMQYITGLKAEAMEPKVVEIAGKTYCDKDLTRYDREPMADQIEATTLTAMIDYIKSCSKELRETMIIHVVSPTCVKLYSGMTEKMCIRASSW